MRVRLSAVSRNLPSEETADLLREAPCRNAARGCGEDGVGGRERAEALRQAGVVDGQRHGRGHPRAGAQHDEKLVLPQGKDCFAQLGELRRGGRVDDLQLVHRAFGPRDAQHAQLGQIAREGGLGGLDALRGEQLRQLLLGGDAAGAQQAPDLLVPLVLAGSIADQPHARIQEPTPLSVKSSPMIECGTRPSSRCTLGTPAESTLRMLFALAFIPPTMVPSSISVSRSAAVSPPSLPETPTASALPLPLSSVTSSVFTEPVSTISTTFRSEALVTRWPSTNSAFPPSFSNVRVISGPPPWTTTGRSPTVRSRRMSSQNDRFSESFTIAAPPYLITQRVPENFWM